jgi:hypothetical protein
LYLPVFQDFPSKVSDPTPWGHEDALRFKDTTLHVNNGAAKRAGMGSLAASGAVELNTGSLQHVFSFLSANDLVLSVKPLNRQSLQYVNSVLEGKASHVSASSDVPPWALQILGLRSLTYRQKKQLMVAAAKGGCMQTLQWASERAGLSLGSQRL